MRRSAAVEYEQMLLARHSLASYNRVLHTLDRSAYILLSLVRVKGPMSIGELSEALGLDASTLNRQTAAAMRSGLLERIPDPDGGIARKFSVTQEGADAWTPSATRSSAAWTRYWPTGRTPRSPSSPGSCSGSTPT